MDMRGAWGWRPVTRENLRHNREVKEKIAALKRELVELEASMLHLHCTECGQPVSILGACVACGADFDFVEDWDGRVQGVQSDE